MADKVQLVALSNERSFNPAAVTYVYFDPAGEEISIGVGERDELVIRSIGEKKAFKRWYADHSTDDYLPDKAPF